MLEGECYVNIVEYIWKSKWAIIQLKTLYHCAIYHFAQRKKTITFDSNQ